MRRIVLLFAAAGTFAEGLLIGGTLAVLGQVIGATSMSMGGTDPHVAQLGLRILAGLVALAMVATAIFLVAAAVRDRPLAGPARGLAIAALTVQWILAIVAGVAGGALAFALALAVSGCLLGALLMDSPSQAAVR
jgi:hypothetical protein